MDCWEVLVNEWCSDEWQAVHDNAQNRRAKMVGVPHHQGSANLYQFGWNWANYNKAEVPGVYDLSAMAHTASSKKAKAFRSLASIILRTSPTSPPTTSVRTGFPGY